MVKISLIILPNILYESIMVFHILNCKQLDDFTNYI